MKPIRLSPWSIGQLKACPERYRLAQIENIRRDERSEAMEFGIGFQELFEAEDPLASIDAANRPPGTDEFDWAVTRETFRALMTGYQARWANDGLEVVATEEKLKLPIDGVPPSLGFRTGRIDHIVRRRGELLLLERKTTRRDIAPESDYWARLSSDDQINHYDLAASELYPDYAGITIYDVLRRPTIAPRALTQKATTEFMESHTYCGQEFEVTADTERPEVAVGDWQAVVTPGKRGWAIRETPEMFGARLAWDIALDPNKWFARREIARTDADRRRYASEIKGLYKLARFLEEKDAWFRNDLHCTQPYKCDYFDVCHRGADPDDEHSGFVRLSVKGN